ncbi:DUF998 domain-containing protein [Microbulbifer sp. OS29]|uniref:DUF998 domain-containing protein n=1 Tax=Microbulbifer okhotskensis TaxID=2926617 RepID=A0A9X2EKN2_9GAMM|nr:DUF998 domain-containing protein [Microbulbifer okhotskensis]
MTGFKYTGYSHSTQFCSELGASGSPTEKLSPIINNYPLGVFFCVFGLYIIQVADTAIALKIIGFLIIVHGIGTWIAGYFPMDADPYTKNPSFSCKVHSWAGMFMMLSLLIAPLVSLSSSHFTIGFRLFSANLSNCNNLFHLHFKKSLPTKK